jgi:hypothetical protein
MYGVAVSHARNRVRHSEFLLVSLRTSESTFQSTVVGWEGRGKRSRKPSFLSIIVIHHPSELAHSHHHKNRYDNILMLCCRSSKKPADNMTKIAIIYYSMYGHVATMADAVKKGVEASGATCDIFQVPETLPDEVLGKMGAPPKKDHPIITADKMTEYDGFIFGLSGRFGTFPAQMKVS